MRVADTSRLRTVLGVEEPDPMAATRDQIVWLWTERRRVERAMR